MNFFFLNGFLYTKCYNIVGYNDDDPIVNNVVVAYVYYARAIVYQPEPAIMRAVTCTAVVRRLYTVVTTNRVLKFTQ